MEPCYGSRHVDWLRELVFPSCSYSWRNSRPDRNVCCIVQFVLVATELLDLHHRAEEVGYAVPTRVQQEALPILLSGRDCILHSQVSPPT